MFDVGERVDVERGQVFLDRPVELVEHVVHAFGFDNPADTGVVYGVLAPWLVLAEQRGLNVECRPMFLESGLRGALHATIHIRPLAVLGTLLAYTATLPGLLRSRLPRSQQLVAVMAYVSVFLSGRLQSDARYLAAG